MVEFTLTRRLAGLACAVLLLATGCGSSSARGSTAVGSGSVLTIGQTADPGGLNPAKRQGGVFDSIAYAALIYPNPDGTYRPGLATSWQYVKDPTSQPNTIFEMTLRHNAAFSDGAPVNAQAVVSWFNYFAHGTSPFASWLAGGTFDAVNEWTVRVHLPNPNPILPYLAGPYQSIGYVASPRAVASPSMLDTNTYGAGAYTLDPSQTVAGDHYTFLPNKYYYDKSQIRWSKVVVKDVSSPTSMLQAMQAGQVDVALPGDASTADAAAAAGLDVVHVPTQATGLAFLDKTRVLADARVRQALNYAVDRKAIASAVGGNYGTPTSEIRLAQAFDPKLQNYYAYDPARAKSLLAAAGYPNGFTLTVLDNSFSGSLGTPLTEAIAKYLSAVGVTVKFTTVSSVSQWSSLLSSGQYTAVTMNMGNPTPYVFYTLFLQARGRFNPTSWEDPMLSAQWQKSSTAADPSGYWLQMMRLTVTQADFLPIFSPHWIYVASKRVGGFQVSPAYLPLPIDWYRK